MNPLYSFGNKRLNGPAKTGFSTQKGPNDKFYKKWKTSYGVYVMYVNKASYDSMIKALNVFLADEEKWKFDFLNLISVFFKIPSEWSDKYFCSKFVAHIINAGYKLDKVSSLYKPEDLKYIDNISCIAKGNDFSKYDKDKALKNLEYIKKHDFSNIKLETVILLEDDIKPYDSRNLQTKDDTEFELPSLESFKPDIQTLFDNADLKHIWLTSDWHFFKNHYKKEANYVNTREILTWCRKNLGKDDIFVYLGDISFRYANKEDQEQSQKFMASIPAGRKILVLGNHDRMLGDEYFTKCGFDYVVEEFTWNKYLFTHRPVNMDIYPSDWWNIHGHCHNIKKYNTTDGLKNVNVYPKFYNNKPVTLDYLIKHKEDLVKNNEWNFNAGYGETTYFIKGVRSGKTLLHEANVTSLKEVYHENGNLNDFQ